MTTFMRNLKTLTDPKTAKGKKAVQVDEPFEMSQSISHDPDSVVNLSY